MTATVKCDTGVFNRTGTATVFDGLTGSVIGTGVAFSSLASPGSYAFTYAQQSSVVLVGLIATGQTNPFWTGYVLIPASGTVVCSDDYETALLASQGGGTGGDTTVYVTVPGQIAQQALTPLQLTFKNYCTLRAALPAIGTIMGRQQLWLTIKRSTEDADAQSLIQVTEAGGLVLASGLTNPTSNLASLVVTDATQGLVNLFIDKSIMGLLPATQGRFKNYVWGLKCELSNGDSTEPVYGQLVVIESVTRSN